jgi:hypothetical protein
MESQKKFNFKQYYDTHPEFKQKHLAKMAEDVTCTCGKVVQKGYLTRHMKGKMHERYLQKKNVKKDEKYEKLYDEIKELKILLQKK